MNPKPVSVCKKVIRNLKRLPAIMDVATTTTVVAKTIQNTSHQRLFTKLLLNLSAEIPFFPSRIAAYVEKKNQMEKRIPGRTKIKSPSVTKIKLSALTIAAGRNIFVVAERFESNVFAVFPLKALSITRIIMQTPKKVMSEIAATMSPGRKSVESGIDA